MTFLSSSKGKLYQPLEAETEDAESLTDTSAYNSGSYTEKKSLSKQLQGADAYLFRPLAALAPVFFVLLVLSLLWNPYFSPSSSTSPSFIPQLSSESRTFDPNTIYDTPSSTESDKAWDELMPPGRGYVLVPNSYDLRLESGIPTDAGIDRYAISGFHQVHCLGIIRKAYYAALDGKDIYLFGEAGADSETLQKYHVEHIGHCFDYLRQGIMCASDTTLESAVVNRDGTRTTVSGWGIEHRECKSWQELTAFATEHQAPHNHTGIL